MWQPARSTRCKIWLGRCACNYRLQDRQSRLEQSDSHLGISVTLQTEKHHVMQVRALLWQNSVISNASTTECVRQQAYLKSAWAEALSGHAHMGWGGRCYINSAATSLRVLREVGEALVDINGQHAAQRLRCCTSIDSIAVCVEGQSHIWAVLPVYHFMLHPQIQNIQIETCNLHVCHALCCRCACR